MGAAISVAAARRSIAESKIAALLAGGRAELGVKTDPAELAHAIGTHRVDLVERFGAASYISAPLWVPAARPSACITFVSAAAGSRPTAPRTWRSASTFAQRAALAIDNALLYTESQEAIRLREEFLSIASQRAADAAQRASAPDAEPRHQRQESEPRSRARLQGKLVIAQCQVDRLIFTPSPSSSDVSR